MNRLNWLDLNLRALKVLPVSEGVPNTSRVVTGSVEVTSEELIIYPNPATGWLTVKSQRKINRINILSMTGDLLYSKELPQVLEYEHNLSVFPVGIYILNVLGQDGHMTNHLFIKQ